MKVLGFSSVERAWRPNRGHVLQARDPAGGRQPAEQIKRRAVSGPPSVASSRSKARRRQTGGRRSQVGGGVAVSATVKRRPMRSGSRVLRFFLRGGSGRFRNEASPG